LGERWLKITSTNVGQSRNDSVQSMNEGNHSSGVSRSEQRRYFVEPATSENARACAVSMFQKRWLSLLNQNVLL